MESTRKSLIPILKIIPLNLIIPYNHLWVCIKNYMHYKYINFQLWVCTALFLTESINFHSFSRDITGLYTMNCYIRKQILYFAPQIDEQRKVSSANR